MKNLRASLVAMATALFLVMAMAASPAMAITKYTGSFSCGSGFNAAIQSYTTGSARHRIWSSYGGTVLKLRTFPTTTITTYRATSKLYMTNPSYMGDASAYGSRAVSSVGGFCTKY